MAKGSKDSRARSWFIVCPNIEMKCYTNVVTVVANKI